MPDETPQPETAAASAALEPSQPEPPTGPAQADASQAVSPTDAPSELAAVSPASNTAEQEELNALTSQLLGPSAEASADVAPTERPATSPASAADVEQATPFAEPELSVTSPTKVTSIDLLNDVRLDVKIELGRTNMYIEDVLKLGVGSVVELDRLAGDPVDIYVSERLIARGEVLVLNDNFCVRINDIHSPIPELEGS